MKALISVPSFDHLHADFAFSLAAMLGSIQQDRKLRREIAYSLHNPRSTIIAHARNLAVREALKVGATHLLFLDSDMVFPVDTLSRLASHHKDIVGANYVRRVSPHTWCGVEDPSVLTMSYSLKPMLHLPFGCILIKTGVFSTLPDPWFNYIEGRDDSETLSEDIAFCNRARRVGLTIHMDPRLTAQVGHIGSRIFTAKDTVPV